MQQNCFSVKQLARGVSGIERRRRPVGGYGECGGTTYRICDWTGVPSHFFGMSNHHFWSYGENLTPSNIAGASWSYTAGSDVIYMSPGLLSYMFNGLGITGQRQRPGNANGEGRQSRASLHQNCEGGCE